MVEDQRSMRSALFFDFGNVFAMQCRDYQVSCYKPSFDELRYCWCRVNLDYWVWSMSLLFQNLTMKTDMKGRKSFNLL